jgi:ribonuclease-3
MSFDLEAVQKQIDYTAKDPQWLRQAFCHKSFHKENPSYQHNEKLEFLGDAVLDLVVSDLLMEKFANDQEGSLSRKRASIVNEDRLFQLAKNLGMGSFLLVGERESRHALSDNPRIVASIFEAVVGAIYKDSGYERAFQWVAHNFADLIEESFAAYDFEKDYKTRFQEWVQENYRKTPRYQVTRQEGPDHDRTFEMEVFIGDESWGKATGSSKKSAAQNAAKQALKRVEK